MEENSTKPSIYISYAWNFESESIVEAIEKKFQKKNIPIIRDKIDLKYKGQIKEFMEQIGRGKYVILIISNKYLQSENCMFELLQIFKNQNFYERIFPLVLDEVKISKAVDRLDFLKYWENETENLDSKIRNLNALANIQGVAEDLNLYTEIRNNIARLTNILKDINTLNTNQHISSDFEHLYNLIHSKIEADLNSEERNENRENVKIKNNKKEITAFLGLSAILITIFIFFIYKDKGDNPQNSTKIINNSILSKADSIKPDTTAVDGNINPAPADTFQKPKETQILKPVKSANIKSVITYEVVLIVRSDMRDATVYVDHKKTAVINKSGNILKIRVIKKDSSHHIEIKLGAETCSTDKLIDEDSIEIPLCD